MIQSTAPTVVHTPRPETVSAAPADAVDIAVIVPVYMGKAFLPELCERLVSSLGRITQNFAIVLVDDRSRDEPWELIRELGQADRRIQGIQLSRNFGQHYALTAGIDHARARWYVVMDCDLQDAPEDIQVLYDKALEGFDIVVGTRRKEGHGFLKRYSSHLFYSTFTSLAGFKLSWNVGNFRIFSDPVAQGFRRMREQMRCLPASFSLLGFDVAEAEVSHASRPEGKSSYTLGKLLGLALGTIIAHSQKPLKFATYLGFWISCASVLAAAWYALRALFLGTPVMGWTSLIVAICLIGGIQIFITGIVGIYVGKCFEESKNRPLYFVKGTCNL